MTKLRDAWGKFKELDSPNPWFRVFDVGNGVLAILEPYHFQEVISFLILGTKKAMLYDTGQGLEDIREVVKSLTDLPIVVLVSHAHADHVGGNSLFDEVYAFDEPLGLAKMRKGYSAQELANQNTPDSFFGDWYDANRVYSIPPCEVQGVPDGYVFDLGGRQLSVVHTPGHNPGSIMLWEKDSGLLFTGDSYYPGPIYAHIKGEPFASSDLVQYGESMLMASQLAGLTLLYTSHNEPTDSPVMLAVLADVVRRILAGELTPEPGPEDGPAKYLVDGIHLITARR